jgi:hypothetical protein
MEHIMRSMAKAIGAGLALAMLGAPSAWAQDDFETQVRGYLDAGMAAHEANGYHRERSIQDLMVPLTLTSPHIWEVNLRAGVNYRIYGACDNDCSDLDMEVYGNDGALVERDVATDDTPFVQITPTRSGRHYVRLWVYACAAEPCYSAARVVSGGTPIERVETPLVTQNEEGATNDDYMGVVAGELEAGGAQHLAAGYARLGDDVIAPIQLAGDGHRQTVHLDARTAYLFQGACDQDCTDVDMEILDPQGRQVAEDVAVDDRPVVAVTPAQAGDYTVRVWLAQCSVEPCYVGIRGFRR